MIELFLVLVLYSVSAEDICVLKIQDGHSNEQDSISAEHCDLYDRLNHNNETTLQVIDMDGTIAGCWLFDGSTHYYNTNLNPSGMCSPPHSCLQYVDCLAGILGTEILIAAATTAPTTTTTDGGIGTVAVNAPTIEPTSRPDPSHPMKDIITIAAVVLMSCLGVVGYIITQTRARADIVYSGV